jgi:hypothetical protein
MQPEFSANSDILLNANTLQPLSKPLLVINNYNNSIKHKNSFSNYRNNIPVSYFAYRNTMKRMNEAGILEKFFSNVYGFGREDISIQNLSEFSTLFDGYNMLR